MDYFYQIPSELIVLILKYLKNSDIVSFLICHDCYKKKNIFIIEVCKNLLIYCIPSFFNTIQDLYKSELDNINWVLTYISLIDDRDNSKLIEHYPTSWPY